MSLHLVKSQKHPALGGIKDKPKASPQQKHRKPLTDVQNKEKKNSQSKIHPVKEFAIFSGTEKKVAKKADGNKVSHSVNKDDGNKISHDGQTQTEIGACACPCCSYHAESQADLVTSEEGFREIQPDSKPTDRENEITDLKQQLEESFSEIQKLKEENESLKSENDRLDNIAYCTLQHNSELQDRANEVDVMAELLQEYIDKDEAEERQQPAS